MTNDQIEETIVWVNTYDIDFIYELCELDQLCEPDQVPKRNGTTIRWVRNIYDEPEGAK